MPRALNYNEAEAATPTVPQGQSLPVVPIWELSPALLFFLSAAGKEYDNGGTRLLEEQVPPRDATPLEAKVSELSRKRILFEKGFLDSRSLIASGPRHA